MRFLPREEKFFELFIEVAKRCHEASGYLKDLFSGKPERWSYYTESIKRLEHEADQVTHEVVTRLNRTFITPIDREDIHLLASDLDNVIDRIDGTARRVLIFKPTDTPAPGVIVHAGIGRCGQWLPPGSNGIMGQDGTIRQARPFRPAAALPPGPTPRGGVRAPRRAAGGR